jgi:hypothetical protein
LNSSLGILPIDELTIGNLNLAELVTLMLAEKSTGDANLLRVEQADKLQFSLVLRTLELLVCFFKLLELWL